MEELPGKKRGRPLLLVEELDKQVRLAPGCLVVQSVGISWLWRLNPCRLGSRGHLGANFSLLLYTDLIKKRKPSRYKPT